MKTLIYDKLDDNAVKCRVCSHFCTIQDGKKGICAVRENQAGELICQAYPKLVAKSIDPIEKKPIFHLKPGSSSYSIATVGCNFQCSFCQNADIAQEYPRAGRIIGTDFRPDEIVQEALKNGCESISYTYTEPTIFCELVLETAKLAKAQGLLNILVTNGYMSRELLGMLSFYIDAANVDLKSFNDQFYRTHCKAKLSPVKENIKAMKALGIMVEITTLLIPGLNDSDDELSALAGFIADKAGRETPWHISRFHPCYRMTDRPATPVSTLEKAYKAGRTAGLKYVYIGNVPGNTREDTLCDSCGTVLIARHAYTIKDFTVNQGECPDCGTIACGIY